MATTISNGAAKGPSGRRTARRLLVLCMVGALTLVGAACSLAPIPGDAPLRYRDAIFATVTKTSDVSYGSALDQQGVINDLKMDIYQPDSDTNTARPVIVFVHGGGFSSGDKSEGDLVDQSNFFAMKGYVTASIDYRLAQPGCLPYSSKCVQAIFDATHDAQAAVRFFRRYASLYKVDTSRIAVDGTSAGGITAQLTGFQSDDPGTSGNPGYPSTVSAAVSLSGAGIFNNSVTAGDAPVLDFHGTADTAVPYSWSQATADAAKAAGVEYNLITWEGDGHVPYVEHRSEILDLTTNFLYRKLDLGRAEGS